MAIKFVTLLTICCALNAMTIEARHTNGHHARHSIGSSASYRGLSHKQGRIFPGAVAIKKLVLLKFKKIVPISLILLKSNKDNEAELVPVYPTDQIPENVQFIPTPNGISGHKDVQAIAIPSELHDQLQINGLANLENIEALLQNAPIAEPESADGNTGAGNIAVAQPEDAPLDVKEDDEDQLLERVSSVAIDSKPVKASNANKIVATAVSPNSFRRLAADELIRTSLRTQPQQTTIEEIPLLLYSANEGSSNFAHNPGSSSTSGRLSGRRFVAAAPVRRHQY